MAPKHSTPLSALKYQWLLANRILRTQNDPYKAAENADTAKNQEQWSRIFGDIYTAFLEPKISEITARLKSGLSSDGDKINTHYRTQVSAIVKSFKTHADALLSLGDNSADNSAIPYRNIMAEGFEMALKSRPFLTVLRQEAPTNE